MTSSINVFQNGRHDGRPFGVPNDELTNPTLRRRKLKKVVMQKSHLRYNARLAEEGRTLLPPSFPAFQKMSRVSPRLSSSRRVFLVFVERFEGDQFRQYQNWKTINMARRPKERNVTVFENSHRSCRKGYPRLPPDVPDVLKRVSVIERVVRSRKTSKTLAQLLA